jgi:hypothetical protein
MISLDDATHYASYVMVNSHTIRLFALTFATAGATPHFTLPTVPQTPLALPQQTICHSKN